MMGFPVEIYNQAYSQVNQHRAVAEAEALRLREEYCAEHPEYARLQRMLSRTGGELAKVILSSGNDAAADVEAIMKNNLETQRRMREMLAADGLSPESFDPKYDCALCGDTGVYNGRLCECVQRIMKRISYENLNALTPLSLSTFDSFSLEHYPNESAAGPSPRKIMAQTLDRCRRYADSFTPESPSLLMYGGVGLGKTHLSLAIAAAAIDKGYDVVYGSANSLFAKVEQEKFGRVRTGEDTLALLCSCDLLILDDLGTEFSTGFTVAALYDIVNTRLLSGKPTIISTNLTLDEIEKKYTERLVSRIYGSYRRLPFVGRDLRIVLRRAAHGGKE